MSDLYCGGQVYGGGGVFAQAFIVDRGVFRAVGANDEIKRAARAGDTLHDLGGAFVCAGLNDSHMHLLGLGSSLRAARLDEHTGSLRDMIDALKAFAAKRPPRGGAWVFGRGWNQDLFTDVRRMPSRYDLDAVSDAYPVAAVRCCGHCLVVNGAALKALGMSENAPDIAGGQIDVENGRFYDRAMDLVYDAMPAPGESELEAMLLSACAEMNACGVTSCQTDDYTVLRDVPRRAVNAAYRDLASRGELSLRVTQQCNIGDLPSLKTFVNEEWRRFPHDAAYRLGPLKLLCDGALGARTAYLSAPYADAPDTRGIALYDQQTLDGIVGFAHEAGLQIACHAIGDAGLDQVLNAYGKALKALPRDDHRHGIVHCQITRDDQLRRMIAMKLHIYAQSVFLDYDSRIVERRAGRALAETSYHWKTLLDGGLSVSDGTDCPVERPDALRGIQCAVTRAPLDGSGAPYLPDQRLTVAEALDGYTLRGAEASFEEAIKGRIAPGYLADFTVLKQSPFSVAPSRIKDIPVLETYLGGKNVYRA